MLEACRAYHTNPHCGRSLSPILYATSNLLHSLCYPYSLLSIPSTPKTDCSFILPSMDKNQAAHANYYHPRPHTLTNISMTIEDFTANRHMPQTPSISPISQTNTPQLCMARPHCTCHCIPHPSLGMQVDLMSAPHLP